ncbi:MAG: sulfatase-like hydrolase/transferase [Myxococcota bacterium]
MGPFLRVVAGQAWLGLVVLVGVSTLQAGLQATGGQGVPVVGWMLPRTAAGLAWAPLWIDPEATRVLRDLARPLIGPAGVEPWVVLAWLTGLAAPVALGGALPGAALELWMGRWGLRPWSARSVAIGVWALPLAGLAGGPRIALVTAAALALGGVVAVGERTWALLLRHAVVWTAVALTTAGAVRAAHALPLDNPASEPPPMSRRVEGRTEPSVDAWRQPRPTGLPRAKNVVVIMVDTLGAKHLSQYDADHDTSPGLAKVMDRHGVIFERNIASAPWTLPSTTSLLTSSSPPRHGVERQKRRLDATVPTLAGAFAAQGWQTAAFVTHIYASSRFGLHSGFDQFWELSIDPTFREGMQLRAGQLRSRVEAWIDQRDANADQPFFMYVHFFDPHWNYDPPAPFDRRPVPGIGRPRPELGTWSRLSHFIPKHRLLSEDDLRQAHALYDGEVAYTDHQLAALFSTLEERGLWEDTVVAIVGDHGEEFQEHRSLGHTRTLYDELIRVPLLLKLPGPGRPADVRPRVPEQVRNLDVAPTLLELAGLRSPAAFEGRSLLPLLREPGEPRIAHARTLRLTELAAVTDGRHKLIRHLGNDRERLFDLQADPREHDDVSAEHPERTRRLGERLDRWLDGEGPSPGDREEVELTPAEKAQLEALGYTQ